LNTLKNGSLDVSKPGSDSSIITVWDSYSHIDYVVKMQRQPITLVERVKIEKTIHDLYTMVKVFNIVDKLDNEIAEQGR